MSVSRKLHIQFVSTVICVQQVSESKVNFPSYSGIDVTQSYNMSHCMKLHILSRTCIHTACTYVTFSGQGALQIFRTSAVATEELSCLHEPTSLYPFQDKMISTLKPCPFGICLTDVKTFWNIYSIDAGVIFRITKE